MKERKNLRAIQAQRFLRYSIRKFSVGVASVAIASGLAVLTGANVQAEEANAIAPALVPAPAPAPAPVNTESTVKPNTEVATANVENKENKPVVENVDKSKLNDAIARLEKALEKAVSTEKTASAIESAKAELASAKAVAANEAATKEEVAKATSAVNGNAFVVESMPKAPAEKKEEKENKNQDSRNGKAIPGQGESGFRDAATAAGYKNDINTVNTELKAAIDKVKVEITKEEALGEGKTNKEKLDMLRAIVAKAEQEKTKATTAAAKADATEQELQAALTEAKQEKDRLNYYLTNAENWGAPINNNRLVMVITQQTVFLKA